MLRLVSMSDIVRVAIIVLGVCCLQNDSNWAQDSPPIEDQRASVDEADAKMAGIDYLHFWLIPQANVNPEIGSVYDPLTHNKIFELGESIAGQQKSVRMTALLGRNAVLYKTKIEPTGSPFFYSCFALTQIGYFEGDYWNFQIFSSVLFLVSVFLLGRIIKLNLWASLGVALLLILLFRPLQVDFLAGNTNRIQLFLLTTICWLVSANKRSYFWGGLVLGLAVMFKLNFLLVPFFFMTGLVLNRQFRNLTHSLYGMLLGGAFGFTVGSGCFGANSWLLWRKFVSTSVAESYPIELGNYSLPNLLQINALVISIGLVGLVWVAAVTAFVLHQRRTDKHKASTEKDEAVIKWTMLGLLVFLLCSPLVWSHYLVLAIPSIVLILIPLIRSKKVSLNNDSLSEDLRSNWLVIGLCSAGAILISAIPVMLFRISNPYVITILVQVGIACLIVSTIATFPVSLGSKSQPAS